MRVMKLIVQSVMLVVLLVGVPVAFLTPGYEQLGYMGIIWIAVFLFVLLVLPRLPMDDLIRFQTQLVIWTGAAISLPFTFPIVSSWAGQPLSIGYAVMGIVARPLLKPLIETVLDWKLRAGRLHNLELATGQSVSSAFELANLAKSAALAEAVYSSVLLAVALTIVLAQAQTVLEPVEQRTGHLSDRNFHLSSAVFTCILIRGTCGSMSTRQMPHVSFGKQLVIAATLSNMRRGPARAEHGVAGLDRSVGSSPAEWSAPWWWPRWSGLRDRDGPKCSPAIVFARDKRCTYRYARAAVGVTVPEHVVLEIAEVCPRRCRSNSLLVSFLITESQGSVVFCNPISHRVYLKRGRIFDTRRN